MNWSSIHPGLIFPCFSIKSLKQARPKKGQANPYRWISNLRQILGSLQWPGFRVVSVLFPTKTVSCMLLWDLQRPKSEWIDTLHSTYPNTWKTDGFGTWSTFISRLFLARLPQILDATFPVRCHSSWTCWRTSFQRRFSDIFQGSPKNMLETIDFPMKKYGVFRLIKFSLQPVNTGYHWCQCEKVNP